MQEAMDILDLSSQEIIKKSSTFAKKSGIYFLITEGQIVYVGKSTDLTTRIGDHTRRRDMGEKEHERFDQVFFIEMSPEIIERAEEHYIVKFLPLWNLCRLSMRLKKERRKNQGTFNWPNYKTLPARIRAMRLGLGLAKYELAKVLGIDPRSDTIGQWERGVIDVPQSAIITTERLLANAKAIDEEKE